MSRIRSEYINGVVKFCLASLVVVTKSINFLEKPPTMPMIHYTMAGVTLVTSGKKVIRKVSRIVIRTREVGHKSKRIVHAFIMAPARHRLARNDQGSDERSWKFPTGGI